MKNHIYISKSCSRKWSSFASTSGQLFKIGFIILLLAATGVQSFAQETDVKSDNVLSNAQELTVKGVVRSADDQLPMEGVNIYLKEKDFTTGTHSDKNGRFEFPRKLNEGDTLIFSFLGYDTQEYVVTKEAKEPIEILMTIGYIQMTGALSTDAVYSSDRSGFKKWWSRMKSLF